MQSPATQLIELAGIAAGGRDIGEVIDAVGEVLEGIIPFDRLSIVLPEEGASVLVSHAFTTDSPGARLRMPAADTSAGRAMAGECFILDLANSPYPSERRLAEALGIHTAIYAPLVSAGTVIGFAAISSTDRNAYTPRHVDNAADLGLLLGPIIECSGLRAAAEMRRDVATRLVEARDTFGTVTEGLSNLIWQIPTEPSAARDTARSLLQELRTSLWNLQSVDRPSRSLTDGLIELARPGGSGLPPLTVGMEGDEPTMLDSRVGDALLHAVSECTRRASRSNGVTRVSVEVEFHPDHIGIAVGQDGRVESDTRWLESLQARLITVGGSLEMRTSPGVGTSVLLRCGYEPRPGEIRPQSPSSPAAARCRVMIVDHQPAVLRGLASMLQAAVGVDVVATANTVAAAVRGIAETRPEIVLFDIGLSGPTDQLTAGEHAMIVTSANPHDEKVFDWLVAGAAGYILRDVDQEQLEDAVRTVLEGGSLLPNIATSRLVGRLSGIDDLTRRELDVLAEIATGATNRVIAERLYIGSGTVKFHVANLLRKLEAANRTEAVARARERGLLN